MKKIRILGLIILLKFSFFCFFISFVPYKIGIYNGQSMNPALNQNDLIVLREFDPEKSELKRGMIVSYEDGENKIIHRIISVMKNQVIVKGDVNNTADQPVLISQIKEIYLLTIPNSVFLVDLISVIKKYADEFVSLAIILFTVLVLLILTRKDGK